MSDTNALAELRGLFNDLRDACVVSFQGLLGLRISEVCGIQARDFPKCAEWPTCITLDRSITGLNELFHLHGRVYKQRDEYEEVKWLAGSRPAGSDYIPPPVKAVAALWRLMRPWREMSGQTTLIVGLGGSGAGFPWTGRTVTRVVSEKLGGTQKSWVEANVDLPALYSGWQLRTHQWRKSFAMNMVRSDARLLPAVRDHFKHMSIAMTERGYLGRDIEMLGLLDDEASYAAAQSMFEAVNGRPASGKAMESIERNAASILELIGDEGTDGEKIYRLAVRLKEDDVRVWSSDWGKCLFRAEVARCHYQALGSFNLNARQPHYGQRRPGVCCDCANLLIFSDDVEFWQARLKSGIAVWEANRAAGEYAAAKVAEDRVRTSALILERLGIDISLLGCFNVEEGEDEYAE
jgi:hypothetical protein